MKFDCGETRGDGLERLQKWHDFFALLPRRVAEHDCRWLETIQRKGTVYCSLTTTPVWAWKYRVIDKHI